MISCFWPVQRSEALILHADVVAAFRSPPQNRRLSALVPTLSGTRRSENLPRHLHDLGTPLSWNHLMIWRLSVSMTSLASSRRAVSINRPFSSRLSFDCLMSPYSGVPE